MSDICRKTRVQSFSEAARMLVMSASTIRLHAGECTGREIAAVQAVLEECSSRIERRGCDGFGGDASDAFREAARILDMPPREIRRLAGSLTASEMRTVRAVLTWKRSELLREAEKEH